MEYIEFPTLAESLATVPRDRIWELISQIAKAARFLEDLSLSHRDIKPDNIAIRPDFQHAVLLDLGVLRPFGPEKEPPVTDAEQQHFIGTLQYSSPELLVREEEDDRDGWRAVTFYQLGAVLHDLIMKSRIFADYCVPFARLVDAVKHVKPEVLAGDVPSDLIVLAKNCLMKNPSARTQYVTWDSFEPKVEDTSREAIAERIRKRSAAERDAAQRQKVDQEYESAKTLQMLVTRIRDLIRAECVATKVFPPLVMTKSAQSDTTADFTIRFGASQADSLRQDLIFGFRLELEDADALALTVRAAALLINGPAEADTSLAKVIFATVFTGVFDDKVFSAEVQRVMLQTLDSAQTQTSIGSLTILLGNLR